MARKPAACGTRGGYARHHRNGEPPCAACYTAQAAANRAWRAGAAAKAGKPEPRRHGDPGLAAVRRHYRHGEPLDPACETASRQDRRAGDRVLTIDTRPVRNGLPEVPYIWRGHRYAWAARTLAAAEEQYGRPDDDLEAAS